MNTKRLNYLLETVIPHVGAMEVIEDYRGGEFNHRLPNEQMGNVALLNFAWFCEKSRATGEVVSDKYDCGLEACLAGWYKILAERDHMIAEDHPDLTEFDFIGLAHHFGISDREAHALFETGGLGAEGGATRKTPEILAARKSYLEDLLAQAA